MVMVATKHSKNENHINIKLDYTRLMYETTIRVNKTYKLI